MSSRSSSSSSADSSTSSSSSLSERTVRLVVQQVIRMTGRTTVNAAAPTTAVFPKSSETGTPTTRQEERDGGGGEPQQGALVRKVSAAPGLPERFSRSRSNDPMNDSSSASPVVVPHHNQIRDHPRDHPSVSSSAAVANRHSAPVYLFHRAHPEDERREALLFRPVSSSHPHPKGEGEQRAGRMAQGGDEERDRGAVAAAAAVPKLRTNQLAGESPKRFSSSSNAIRKGSSAPRGGALVVDPQELHERRMERARRVQAEALREETFTPRIHKAPPTPNASPSSLLHHHYGEGPAHDSSNRRSGVTPRGGSSSSSVVLVPERCAYSSRRDDTMRSSSGHRDQTEAANRPHVGTGRWEERLYTESLYRRQRAQEAANRMTMQMLKELQEEAECTFQPNTAMYHHHHTTRQGRRAPQEEEEQEEDASADPHGTRVAGNVAKEASERLFAQAPRVSKETLRERLLQQYHAEAARRQRQLEGAANETQLRLFEERQARDKQRREQEEEAIARKNSHNAQGFLFSIKGVYYETNPPPKYADPGSFQRLYSDHFRRQATLASAQDQAVRELPKGIPKITPMAKEATSRHKNPPPKPATPRGGGGAANNLNGGAAVATAATTAGRGGGGDGYVMMRLSRQPSTERYDTNESPSSPQQQQQQQRGTATTYLQASPQSPTSRRPTSASIVYPHPAAAPTPIGAPNAAMMMTSPMPPEPSSTPLRMEFLDQHNSQTNSFSAPLDPQQLIQNWDCDIPRIEVTTTTAAAAGGTKRNATAASFTPKGQLQLKSNSGVGGFERSSSTNGPNSPPHFLGRTQPRQEGPLQYDDSD